MTKRATSRALSLLPKPPHILLHEALDLFLRQLLAEGGHVFAPLGDDLDQVRVSLVGLKLSIREVPGVQLLAFRGLSPSVLAVALGAVLLEERGRMLLLRRKERQSHRRDRAEHRCRQESRPFHLFSSFFA